MSKTSEGPRCVNEKRRKAKRSSRRAWRVGEMERSNSPGSKHILMVARYEIDDGYVALSPLCGQSVETPSSAAVSEIIGPAGSDMQISRRRSPSFQILNEERKARQQWRKRGAASIWRRRPRRRSQLRDLAGELRSRGRVPKPWNEGQRNDSRSIRVWAGIWGSEKSQVPPAKPRKALLPRRRFPHARDGALDLLCAGPLVRSFSGGRISRLPVRLGNVLQARRAQSLARVGLPRPSLERNGASVGNKGFKPRFFISRSIAARPPPPSSSTSMRK